LSVFYSQCYDYHLAIHHFPTRRSSDLQNVQTVYVVRIKPRETVVADQFSSDYFEIIDFLPGDEAAQTREEWEQRRKEAGKPTRLDRKSTRLNSSHVKTSYAVFCLKKKR